MKKTQLLALSMIAAFSIIGLSACQPTSSTKQGNLTSSANADEIPLGRDLYETTSANYNLDIPADFFGPDSDPFKGVVSLESGSSSSGGTGTVDTIVERMGSVSVSGPLPSKGTVDTEILLLSLKSVDPITVNFPTGSELWNLRVILSPTHPPQGQMTITKTNKDGGTFQSTLYIQPLFIFTRKSDATVLKFDTGAEGLPPIKFTSGPTPWVHDCPDDIIQISEISGENFCPSIDNGKRQADIWTSANDNQNVIPATETKPDIS